MYRRAKIMGGKTNDEPRSGCRKINNIGSKKTPATFANTRKESPTVPISDLARILAAIIRVPIFAPSVGWMVMPRSIHLLAPIWSTLIGLNGIVNIRPTIPAM